MRIPRITVPFSSAFVLCLSLLALTTATASYAQPDPIADLEATDGRFENRTELTWTPPTVAAARIAIYRTPEGDILDMNDDLLAGVASGIGQYVDTTGDPGQVYSYCLTVIDGSGNESATACDDGSRKLFKPTGFRATDGTLESEVLLTWTDRSNVESGYTITRNGTLLTTLPANRISYSDTTAAQGTEYSYCAAAINADGFSSEEACDFGTRAFVTPPANVVATDGQFTDKIRITWDDQSDSEDEYVIYRDEIEIGTVPADSTLYDDVPPLAEQPYTYFVTATSGGMESVPIADDGMMGGLTAPENLVASVDVYDDRVELTWDDVADTEDGFEITRDGVPLDTLNANNTRYNDFTAEQAMDYQYCVRSFSRADEGMPSYSAFDCAMGRRSAILPPEAVAASEGDFEDRVEMTWTNVSTTVMFFNIYRVDPATPNDTTLINTMMPELPFHIDRALASDVDYSYCISGMTVPGAVVNIREQARAVIKEAQQVTFQVDTAGAADATTKAVTRDQMARAIGVQASAFAESAKVCATGSRSINAPSAVDASYAVYEDRVEITWVDNSAVERGYIVSRLAENDLFPVVVDTVSASRVSLGDYVGAPGTEYTYSVVAYDAYGTSADDTDIGFRQLEAPTAVVASDGASETQVFITWRDNSRAETGYQIRRDGVPIATTDANVTSYVATGGTIGVTYDYAVAAVDDFGTSFADTDEGGTAILPPGDVSASDTYGDKVTITWTDESDLNDDYRILRDGILLSYTDNANATRFTDVNAVTGVSHEYCVEATRGARASIPRCDVGLRPSLAVAVTPDDVLVQSFLNKTNGVAEDRYGNVAVFGNYAAIIAFNVGQLFFYEFDPVSGTWGEIQSVQEPTNGIGASLAMNEDYLLAGEPTADEAIFFKRNGSEFEEVQRIPAPVPFGRFGDAVDITDGYAIVGDYLFNSGVGHAHIYKLNGTTWEYEAELSNPEPDDPLFGINVAIDGAYAVLGAYRDDENGDDAGAAYVFRRDGATWSQEAKLLASDGVAGDQFGFSVAIEGDRIVVGAVNNLESSRAYVFEREGTTWTETAILASPDGMAEDSYGIDVALNNEYVVVGASRHDALALNAGAAYVFREDGDTWTVAAKLLPGNSEGNANANDSEQFGVRLALGAHQAFIAATGFNDRRGATYVQPLLRVPQNVTASNGTYDGRIQVRWSDTNYYEDGYNVYRREADGEFQIVGTTQANNELFDDFSAEAGGAYTYCVAAFNADDEIFGDQLSESSRDCDTGWRPANGAISGRVAALGGGGTQDVDVCLTPNPNRGLLLDGVLGHIRVDALTFPNDELTAFTMSFWMRSSELSKDGTPFSYAANASNTNGILLIDYKDFILYVNGENTGATGLAANDGEWHHITVTWRSSDGQALIYKDGVLEVTETLATGETIPAGGILILGQDQDVFGGDGGFSLSQAFSGEMDEVRLWNKARTQADIQADMMTRLTGKEAGLVGYWPLDEGTRKVVSDQTGNNNGLLVDGAFWTDNGSVPVCATSDLEGNYTLARLRYGTSTEYTVTPSQNRRAFNPGFKTITLTKDSPVQNEVDFIDKTAFTVSGQVLFENTECPVPGVDLYAQIGLESPTLEGTSESDGTFALSLEPSDLNAPDGDPRVIEPRLGSIEDAHIFLPADTSLVLDSDVTDLRFFDTKTRTLTGFFGGGCGFGIGTATLKIFTENGCYQQIEVDISGPFEFELPPQAYLVQVESIDVDPALAHLEADIVQFFDDLGAQFVDLTEAADTLDLIYRAPLTVTFEGFPEPPTMCEALTQNDEDGNTLLSLPVVPVIAELATLPLTIRVNEDYGGSLCPVTEGKLTVFDGIADRAGEPQEFDIQNGVASYTTVAATPNVFSGARVDGVDRSFQKSLAAVAFVEGRDPVTSTEWVMVEGHRPREATFVSATTDPIPMMILHDPPGGNSYAYIEEGTTMCERMSSVSLFGGGAGPSVDLKIGAIADAGLGLSFENGLGFKVEAQTVIGKEVTELSAGACYDPDATLVALYAAGVLALPTFGISLLTAIPLLVTTAKDCDGDASARNFEICTTFTERWSTSSDNAWAGEDLYMGTALNLIFAETDVLEVDQQACTLDLSEALAMDLNPEDAFETVYVYGKSHIGLTLIPALEELAELAGEDQELNGDPDGDGDDDAITLRQSIDAWGRHLALGDALTELGVAGECVQMDADGVVVLDADGAPEVGECPDDVDRPFTTENRSFSSGVEYEYSRSIDSTRTVDLRTTRIYIDADGAVGLIGTVLGYDQTIAAAFEIHKEWVTEEEDTEGSNDTVGYVLSDGDTGDFFSVDVGTDPVYQTPVFKIKSGRSSNPWEANTQKRDNPKISVSPQARFNVPADETTNFTLSITNASESQERRRYMMAVPGEANPGNAGLTVTGDLLGGERLESFLIDPGETTSINLGVYRGPAAYEYDSLAVIVYPEADYEIWKGDPRQDFPLSDTAWFSVHFEAPCSDISILRPEEFWSLNASTVDDSLGVILHQFALDVSESDAVEKLGLEYRFAGTPDWLPAVDVMAADLDPDATSWSARWLPQQDGDYEIRAFTECPIGGKVFSEPLAGIVDTRPPQVFAAPEPADEVLALGGSISVTFEEPLDCGTVDATGPFANTFLTYADGPDAGTAIPVDALCDGRTLVLRPDAAFDWAQAENRLLEARLRKGIVDGQNNPREVTDLVGNPIEEDVAWTFTVRRSAFTWQPTYLRVGSSSTLAATLVNGRAQPASFTLDGVPSWLTPSLTEGTVPPGGALPITFDVDLSAALAADTIAAVTSSGNALLYLQCAPPDWQLNPANFAYSMTLTGQLFVGGVASDDPNDLVAAFVGDQLRGLAAVAPEGGGNRVPMTIYSNTPEGETVTFRVYDASACLTYPGTDRVETFVNGSAVGTQEQPVAIVPTFTAPQQQIALNAGWTWFSLNRTPGSSALRDVLGTVEAGTGDVVKSQTAFSLFDPAAGWIGAQADVAPGSSYQIRLGGGGTLVIDGSEVAPTTPIPVVAGWNWIGYLPQVSLDVNTALASLAATDGDQVKSQYQFAQYDGGSSQWVGSLTQLDPGLGYQLHVAQGGTLVYPAAQPDTDTDRLAAVRASGPAVAQTLMLTTDSTAASSPVPQAFDPAAYPHAMTLIGDLTFDGEALTDPATRVWVTDEAGVVRGIGQVQHVDALDAPRVFLMLYGDVPQGEAFDVHVYHPATGQTVTLPQQLNFKADVRAGSVRKPVAIEAETEAYQAARAAAELPAEYALQQNYPNPFNPETTIRYALPEAADVSLEVYDLLGRRVQTLVDASQQAGHHTVRFDASQLASGVYLYRIEAGTFKAMRKMVLVR